MKSAVVLAVVLTSYLVAPFPVWDSESLHACPNISAQKDLTLEEVAGDWRLAYLFLGQVDEGLDEDNTCVVVALTPTNETQLELSVFIDSLRANHIDRSTIQLSADIVTPGEWKVYTPLTSAGYLHARVIRGSNEHLVVTFCGPDRERAVDDEVDSTRSKNAGEEALDWKSLFDSPMRKKRSGSLYPEKPESHMWTAVLVKHNNVSAMKFVEYAAVLMKHGYDITQGELVSFGKCPVAHHYDYKNFF